jgi:ribonuclease VapC
VILDTSVIVGVMVGEPGHERIRERMATASILAVGAATMVEVAIVLSTKLRRDPRPQLNRFLREMEVEVIPFTAEHYEVAVDAFQRFGKGRHPAALNFGDCLTYAVARLSGFPLLFTGDDFARTDICPTAELP